MAGSRSSSAVLGPEKTGSDEWWRGTEFDGSLIYCVGNLMTEIQGNGNAPFRFLTPFPHRSPRRLRNSALKTCHFEPDDRNQSFFIRLILTCSNILGGRFHRLPSVNGSVRLNLQGRFFHSRVFFPLYPEENRFYLIVEIGKDTEPDIGK